MQKIKLTTGGHKFRVQDITIMQDGIIDALNALAQGLNGNSNPLLAYYLIKPTVTGSGGGPYTVTPGYIYYNGEIYPIDAQSGVTGTGTLWWQIEKQLITPTALPNENVPTATGVKYQNGTFNEVHIRNRMNLVVSVTQPTGSVATNAVEDSNIVNVIQARAAEAIAPWTLDNRVETNNGFKLNYSTDGGGTFSTLTSGNTTITSNYKVTGKTVIYQFQLSHTQSITGAVADAVSFRFPLPSTGSNLFGATLGANFNTGTCVVGQTGNQHRYTAVGTITHLTSGSLNVSVTGNYVNLHLITKDSAPTFNSDAGGTFRLEGQIIFELA